MKKKRILINANCSENSLNAQDRNGKHWALFLDKNKYNLSMFCSGNPDKRIKIKEDIKIIKFKKSKFKYIFKMIIVFLFGNYDIFLNAKSSYREKIIIKIKKAFKIKTKIITFSVNQVPYGEDSFSQRIANYVLFKSDYLIANSKRGSETVFDYRGINIPVINNFYDLTLFHPQNYYNNRKKVICVASMLAVKRPFLFANIAKVTPEADFIWVGKRYYFNDMKRKINSDNINNLKLTGNIENHLLPKILANADIFLYPSIHEGFPSVIVEAMACGLPVIVMDRFGPEAVINNKTGYVVKSEFEMLEKLKYLLNNEELIKEFGKNAIKRAFDYDGKKVVIKLEKFIEEITKNKS